METDVAIVDVAKFQTLVREGRRSGNSLDLADVVRTVDVVVPRA